jgi:ABC-type Fe3+/spermidine/putrescine transport system ATPase subunit
MPTAIALRDLSKHFGSGADGTVAVDRISLDIQPGELFFLLGPSGCGKTTLLRMIAGFIEPTGGRVLFDGRDVTFVPPNKRNTGMVFQSYALWPHMTVGTNVAFGLGIRRIPADERDRRVADALVAVRMAEYAERKPNQLSGGQQQRVALARALVIRPDVLLLDEPLSNLDARLRIELRSEIRRVCKEAGITAVYVTHDQKEALSMADRIAVMDRGRVVQIGPPEELYRRPASRFVAEFLGETNLIPGMIAPPGRSAAEGNARTPDAKGPAGLLEIRTAAGPLWCPPSSVPEGPRPGGEALLSIRPEAFRLSHPAPPNTLSGTIVEAVYLGELAQYTIELAGGVRVKAADLNPLSARSRTGDAVTLSVDPADIVVLPATDPPPQL